MSDDLEKYMIAQPATPERPLQALTVLVVEDSRFASEAIRLLCLRSGARIRRADSLGSAHRHLRVYRPSIVIVDIGLPDGSGLDLIKELSEDCIRVPVLLAMSGDETREHEALEAGADGFFAKPVESLAAFQQMILSKLPPAEGPMKPRALPKEVVEPDRIALQDDLSHVAEIIRNEVDGPTQDYVAQFLTGLARSAHDNLLEEAASNLAAARTEGLSTGSHLKRVAHMIEERLLEKQVL